ncbi:hypothetical protein [uncultured Bartonella sp.]|nr:hypothetical protein [uncultured Bartonella sp.]
MRRDVTPILSGFANGDSSADSNISMIRTMIFNGELTLFSGR